MNNQSYKIFFKSAAMLLVLALSFSSCKKFLEVTPKDQVSDATLWSSTENAGLFLNNIYASIPSIETNDPWDNYSDNSLNGQAGRVSTNIYGPGIYTASNAPSFWSQYDNIRKCNLFIQNVSTSDLADSWKKVSLAEARFLRAYFYSLLWKFHGGVPIITDVLNQTEQGDEIFRARNTSDETFAFIQKELTEIEADLSVTAESGRATRGAALTLKGSCELFQASPLKNPSNDKTKWATAAATFKKVMDLNNYSLFSDYNTMFFEANNNNVEVIFSRQHLGGTSLANFRDGQCGPRFVRGSLTGWGHQNPTQDIVDEYLMANGLPITDPASGYDPQNPYVGREKRFYESIVYDGSVWLDDIFVMKQGVGSLNATDLNNSSISTRTGYYLRKGINPTYASAQNNGNSANWIIFRYAEVLLSYAEAQNEATGPDATISAAVNEVRERSDLPDLPVLNQAQMRIAIQRERRIELAFEEKRLPDLLRLKLAEVNLNGTVHAMKIEKVGNDWIYTVVPAGGGNKKFDPAKNYVLPIPQSAIDKNPQLVQSPGY